MVSYVSDYTALLSGSNWTPAGTPTVLTYSFDTVASPEAVDQFGSASAATFLALNAAQVATVRDAVGQWEAAGGLVFTEVAPGQGDIRFGNLDFDTIPGQQNSAGFAYLPARAAFPGNSSELDIGGDVFVSADGMHAGFELIAHEMGHALGLKHPHEGDIRLRPSVDNGTNTLLSYNRPGILTDLGPLDLRAMEHLYGPHTFVASMTGGMEFFTYDFSAFETTQVWGTAASEILGSSLNDVVIAGAGNDTVAGFRGDDHLHGGTGADTLLGGIGDDFLIGGAGVDFLGGEEGIDTAHFEAYARQAEVSWNAGSGQGSSRIAGEADSFLSIEQLSYLDGLYVSGNGAAVARLYDTAFGRDADRDGLSGWSASLENGTPLTAVAASFVNSTEFQDRYGTPDNDTFVTLLYRNTLDRQPDAPGRQGWVDAMNNGLSEAEVMIGFSESEEHVDMLASRRIPEMTWVGDADGEAVARLYMSALDRLPDVPGLAGWLGQVRGGLSLEDVAAGFVDSFEFSTRYGPLDNDGFVEQLYLNVLDRGSDPGGKAGWVGGLDSGSLGRDDVLLGFSESTEHMDETEYLWDDGITFA